MNSITMSDEQTDALVNSMHDGRPAQKPCTENANLKYTYSCLHLCQGLKRQVLVLPSPNQTNTA